MGRAKKYSAEQIVNLLRQIELAVANGNRTLNAGREGGITEQTCYRWRRECGGLHNAPSLRAIETQW
jgi:hypothetical protein